MSARYPLKISKLDQVATTPVSLNVFKQHKYQHEEYHPTLNKFDETTNLEDVDYGYEDEEDEYWTSDSQQYVPAIDKCRQIKVGSHLMRVRANLISVQDLNTEK